MTPPKQQQQGPLGLRGVLMLARARRARLGLYAWSLIAWIAQGGGFLGSWPGRPLGGRRPRQNRRVRRC